MSLIACLMTLINHAGETSRKRSMVKYQLDSWTNIPKVTSDIKTNEK